MMEAIWPLAGLQVITPAITLRHISDELAVELTRLAALGIHDPATMPFSDPWTDSASPQLERNALRYFWHTRSDVTRDHWDLALAVITDEHAVGVCTVHAEEFPACRTVTTGSWLGQRYQGHGIGREMRQAALHLIFEGFDAEEAATRAWHDNAASLGVTRSLPYAHTGDSVELRRGRQDTMVGFTMSRRQWESIRRNDIRLSGIAEVLAQLEIS